MLKRFLLALLLALAAGLALAQATPMAPVVLDENAGSHDAWPAVTVLKDPGGSLSASQALAAADQFHRPQSAYATLGVNKGTVVWVRIPVVVPPEGNGEWTLNIDYSQINRVDVFAATEGILHSHTVTGNLQPVVAPAAGVRPRCACGRAAPAARQRACGPAAGGKHRLDDPAYPFFQGLGLPCVGAGRADAAGDPDWP